VQDVKDLMQRLIGEWAGVEETIGTGVSIPAFSHRRMDVMNIHCDKIKNV